MAVSLVMLPLYTRRLSTADYGVVDLLVTTQNLFGLLLGGRFADTLFFYHGTAEGVEAKRRSVSTAMWGSLLIGLVLALSGCLLAPLWSRLVFQSPQFTGYFRLSFIGLGLSMPLETGLGWMRTIDRPGRFVWFPEPDCWPPWPVPATCSSASI